MAESLRAAYVHGLETELAFLERQPNPKADRIADVKKQLSAYAKSPEKPERETAAKSPADTEQGVQLEHDIDAKRAEKPAKKAAATPERTAARKAAAKKAAAKKPAEKA